MISDQAHFPFIWHLIVQPYLARKGEGAQTLTNSIQVCSLPFKRALEIKSSACQLINPYSA